MQKRLVLSNITLSFDPLEVEILQILNLFHYSFMLVVYFYISRSPNLQDAPLYIAGVPSIDVILKRPSQVSVDDFTGCMRNIYINGAHLDKSTALTSKGVTSGCTKASGCSSIACKNGQCIDDWKGFQCQCKTGFAGETCATGK